MENIEKNPDKKIRTEEEEEEEEHLEPGKKQITIPENTNKIDDNSLLDSFDSADVRILILFFLVYRSNKIFSLFLGFFWVFFCLLSN